MNFERPIVPLEDMVPNFDNLSEKKQQYIIQMDKTLRYLGLPSSTDILNRAALTETDTLVRPLGDADIVSTMCERNFPEFVINGVLSHITVYETYSGLIHSQDSNPENLIQTILNQKAAETPHMTTQSIEAMETLIEKLQITMEEESHLLPQREMVSMLIAHSGSCNILREMNIEEIWDPNAEPSKQKQILDDIFHRQRRILEECFTDPYAKRLLWLAKGSVVPGGYINTFNILADYRSRLLDSPQQLQEVVDGRILDGVAMNMLHEVRLSIQEK